MCESVTPVGHTAWEQGVSQAMWEPYVLSGTHGLDTRVGVKPCHQLWCPNMFLTSILIPFELDYPLLYVQVSSYMMYYDVLSLDKIWRKQDNSFNWI